MRRQVHVSDGAGDQLTSDAEPFGSRCGPGPVIEAIKDCPFKTKSI